MPARPSHATVALASLALTLALAVTALASSGSRQKRLGEGGLRLTTAGALRIADSRGEAAILSASALAPGGSVSGMVTIRNRGADARLVLSRHHLMETAAPDGTSLAAVLRLRIRDLTRGSRRIVYRGGVATMPTLQLGALPAGTSRRYRFVAKLSEPGLVDNGLMGARVRFDYRWHLRR